MSMEQEVDPRLGVWNITDMPEEVARVVSMLAAEYRQIPLGEWQAVRTVRDFWRKVSTEG